jgi:hypothetical protein
MNRWSVLGVLMILVGLVVLFLMWGFIVEFVETVLKIIAVVIGILLVLGGAAAIAFGGRWRKRTVWGPAPTNT